MTTSPNMPTVKTRAQTKGDKTDASPFMNHNNKKTKGTLLKHSLHLKHKEGHGHGRSYTIEPIEEELPFDKGFFLFIRALQLLVSKNEDRIIMVGLAGPSGAGKTVFSEKVGSDRLHSLMDRNGY